MVYYIVQWDLPDQKANLTIYSNKAKNDWLPMTLAAPGVREIRNLRNPLEVSPQVAIMIEFESLQAWEGFIESQDYIRIMRELRILGCTNFDAKVWCPSRYFPESLKRTALRAKNWNGQKDILCRLTLSIAADQPASPFTRAGELQRRPAVANRSLTTADVCVRANRFEILRTRTPKAIAQFWR